MHFRDSCTFHDRDRWIGLYRPSDVPACGCSGNVSAADCEQCRQSFVWINGTQSSISRFSDGEPGSHEACVRLQFSGSWAGLPCHRKLKSVCKRSKFNPLLCLYMYLWKKYTTPSEIWPKFWR